MTHNPLEDEEEIQNFWGQLWFVPKTNPVERTRVREARGEDLVWIRRDLWLAKTFDTSDCHLVGDGDKWDALPSKLSFAENIWGEGKRRSFARVLKETMAGRGRGRGPRPRNPEEDWENWGSGGWNQFQFPQPPPPPVFYNQPPPPPYGYFPNQAQVHHPPPHPPNPGFGRQFEGPRPRGGGYQGRGRGRQQQQQQPNRQAQGQVQNQIPNQSQEGQELIRGGNAVSENENQVAVDGALGAQTRQKSTGSVF